MSYKTNNQWPETKPEWPDVYAGPVYTIKGCSKNQRQALIDQAVMNVVPSPRWLYKTNQSCADMLAKVICHHFGNRILAEFHRLEDENAK